MCIRDRCETTHFKALAFHDPAQALEILDPDKTRSRGFYIPDNATPKLREIRAAKKQIEEQLHHAQTDACLLYTSYNIFSSAHNCFFKKKKGS